MNVYKFLLIYKSIFVIMARQGISQNDIAYLGVYDDYISMLEKGQKEAEIYTFLAERYKLSASTIKRAIKRLNQAVEI